MGIKKIAMPVNKAKNDFVQWLESKDAEMIYEFEGVKDIRWDYYREISGFVNDNLYTVYFMVWNGEVEIRYSDWENNYEGLSTEEFLELIR